MPDLSDWPTWAIYAGGFFAISYFMLLVQVDHLNKRLDRITELLFHIDAVEKGAMEQRKMDKWWRNELRRTRFGWLRKLAGRPLKGDHRPSPALED